LNENPVQITPVVGVTKGETVIEQGQDDEVIAAR